MKGSGSSPAQIVTAVAAAVALLYFFRGILVPFFLATVITVVIYAVTDFTIGLVPKAPRWIAMVLTGVVVIALMIASFDVTLRGLAELIPQTQQMVPRLQNLLQTAVSAVGLGKAPDLQSLLGSVDPSALVQGALANATDALSEVGLVILFVIFLLASRTTVESRIATIAASASRTEQFKAVLKQVDHSVRSYVLVQTLTGALIAISAGIVMYAVGLQNVFFWSIMIFLAAYIPVVGSLVGSLAPALFALVQFPTIWQAATTFVAILSIHTIVGNFVLPKIQAASQNINPVAGIFAFSAWSLLWGISGAILATPLTLTLMIVLAQFERTQWIAVLISNDGKPGERRNAAAQHGG